MWNKIFHVCPIRQRTESQAIITRKLSGYAPNAKIFQETTEASVMNLQPERPTTQSNHQSMPANILTCSKKNPYYVLSPGLKLTKKKLTPNPTLLKPNPTSHPPISTEHRAKTRYPPIDSEVVRFKLSRARFDAQKSVRHCC